VADIDAVDGDAPAGQLVGVAAGAAADVEHPVAGPEGKGVDEEVDLLRRSLGEGIAEVGGAEVVGDRLEPVLGLAHRASLPPALTPM
jgi:hypothetical protein